MICPGIIDQHVTVLQDEAFLHAAMRDYCLVVCVPEYGKSMFLKKCVTYSVTRKKSSARSDWVQNSNTEFLKNEEKLCWIAKRTTTRARDKISLDRFESLSA